MNIRRVLFTLLMVTVFLVPLLAGLIAAGVSTAVWIGWRAGEETFRWLVDPKARP